ncbi:hypothetical protein [Nitratireductor sp.]|uniref:hypothetical protein n=1 Tax=Nitratireductor sp. TaxID=1872084 RepID=UPI00263897B9|nr:hypothetical protein [Nitratireductor sp.]MCV0380928.1 hypothetical protein [Nitratireductor sp.]
MAYDVTRMKLLRAGSIPAQQRAFMEWLLSLPGDADLEYAARRQLAEIDRRLPNHPEVQYLRLLLSAFSGSDTMQ